MKQNKITPIYVAARRPIDIAVLITEELDETAWDVQDKVDEGLIPEQAYLDAFSKARAVAAVGCALKQILSRLRLNPFTKPKRQPAISLQSERRLRDF